MLAILQAMGLLRSCCHAPILHGCDPPFSPSELMEMERDEQGFIERNPHLFPNMFPPPSVNRLLKKKKGVVTHTLVPYGAYKTIVPKILEIQPIVIREMPENLHFSASLRILKDTVVLFSGRRPFSVAIRQKLITESLKGIFDFLWSVSAPKN